MTIDVGEDVEKGEHTSTVGGSAIMYSQFLRKTGMSLSQDLAIPLLGTYPQDVHSYNKEMCLSMFIASLLVIATTWKQARR